MVKSVVASRAGVALHEVIGFDIDLRTRTQKDPDAIWVPDRGNRVHVSFSFDGRSDEQIVHYGFQTGYARTALMEKNELKYPFVMLMDPTWNGETLRGIWNLYVENVEVWSWWKELNIGAREKARAYQSRLVELLLDV